MKALANLFGSLPIATRVIPGLFALGFPIGFALARLGFIDLYSWMVLTPEGVWRGEVWRLVTYGFFAGGIVDWVIHLFWLVTLVSVVGRNWSGRSFWMFALMAIVAGAVPLVLARPGSAVGFTGCAALIFALLVAWDRIYRRERLVLLGIGEISVRQAAVLIGIIEILIVLFCFGLVTLLSMMCGGVAAWIYFAVRHRFIMGRASRTIPSERMARLEL
jgi:membrane associated rhomboid family serine protease